MEEGGCGCLFEIHGSLRCEWPTEALVTGRYSSVENRCLVNNCWKTCQRTAFWRMLDDLSKRRDRGPHAILLSVERHRTR